jgi:hypothetical protein
MHRCAPELAHSARLAFATLCVATLWGLRAPAQTPTTSPTPAVRRARVQIADANGKLVASDVTLTSEGLTGFTAVVPLRVDGHLVLLQVGRQGFVFDPAAQEVDFQSADCSGTPYVYVSNDESILAAHAAVGPPGSTIYAPDLNAVPTSINVNSCYIQGACVQQCYNDTSSNPTLTFVPAIKTVDPYTVFTPPFSIR